jgi:hypothetical protein
MRPILIVIDTPRVNLLSGTVQRDEHIRVQAPVAKAKPSVETLNHGVFHGFAGSDEIRLYAVGIGPGIQRLRGEFAAVV